MAERASIKQSRQLKYKNMAFSEHTADRLNSFHNMNENMQNPDEADICAERLEEIEASVRKLEAKFGLLPGDKALIVNPARQELYLVQNHKIQKRYAISTSAKGLGGGEGTGQTPIGTHKISEKIGGSAPVGAVFKHREFAGNEVVGADYLANQNEPKMLTRILWLSGLEPGINAGEGVDTHERNIYIHGTNQEQRIGTPASGGCIRMKNNEVTELYDLVSEGVLVEVENKPYMELG